MMGAEVVAPQPGLCPVTESLAAVRLLAVNVDRQPQSGLKILAPAIKVEIKVPTPGIDSRAVQANNRVVMVLHPNTPCKSSYGLGVERMDINCQAADVTQVFPANRLEG